MMKRLQQNLSGPHRGRNLRRVAAVVAIGGVMLVSQNCARVPLLDQIGLDLNTRGTVSLASIEPISAPYALLTGDQTLRGMLKVSGVEATNNIKNEFNARSSAFSSGPDLKLTTAGMMIGFTSLAGEVCMTMVNADAAQADVSRRNFFASVDFTKAASTMSNDTYKQSVRAMARNFWSRNETDEELSAILDARVDFEANYKSANDQKSANSTKNLLMSTCSAMLSSVDAVTY